MIMKLSAAVMAACIAFASINYALSGRRDPCREAIELLVRSGDLAKMAMVGQQQRFWQDAPYSKTAKAYAMCRLQAAQSGGQK
tara:strand:- start:132 stop:380 length:249 start_codon:yes stop_codon:yes gene_type:complete